MHPARKQRLIAVVGVVVGISIALSLTLLFIGENIDHFYLPADIQAGKAEVGQKLRVGGLVKEGSVERSATELRVDFTLEDNGGEVVVTYAGILPDLFREGQGIIAIGRLSDSGNVVAEEVLAKHDETYMPPEIQKAMEEQGHPGKSDY